MNVQLLTLIGYAIAAAAVGLAIFYYNRVGGLQTLLAEAAAHYDSARKSLQKAEYEAKNLREKTDEQREAIQRLERSLEDARQKTTQANQEKQALRDANETKIATLQRSYEHLSEQVHVLTSQIAEADAERQALRKERDELAQSVEQRVRQGIRPATEEANTLKNALADVEKAAKKLKSENERLTTLLKTVDPVQIKKYRQRIISMEQIVTSMRGLREMAEERSQNYEVALRKLSSYIVRGQEALTLPPSVALGPLVGEALEKIGARLVDDEEEAREKSATPEANDHRAGLA